VELVVLVDRLVEIFLKVEEMVVVEMVEFGLVMVILSLFMKYVLGQKDRDFQVVVFLETPLILELVGVVLILVVD